MVSWMAHGAGSCVEEAKKRGFDELLVKKNEKNNGLKSAASLSTPLTQTPRANKCMEGERKGQLESAANLTPLTQQANISSASECMGGEGKLRLADPPTAQDQEAGDASKTSPTEELEDAAKTSSAGVHEDATEISSAEEHEDEPVENTVEMATSLSVPKSSSVNTRDKKSRAAPKQKIASKVTGRFKKTFRNRFASKKVFLANSGKADIEPEAPTTTGTSAPPAASVSVENQGSNTLSHTEPILPPSPSPPQETISAPIASDDGPNPATSGFIRGKMTTWKAKKLLKAEKKRIAKKDQTSTVQSKETQFLTVLAVSDESLSVDEPQETTEEVVEKASTEAFDDPQLSAIAKSEDAASHKSIDHHENADREETPVVVEPKSVDVDQQEKLTDGGAPISAKVVTSPSGVTQATDPTQRSRSRSTRSRSSSKALKPRKREENPRVADVSFDIDTFDDDLSNTFAPKVGQANQKWPW